MDAKYSMSVDQESTCINELSCDPSPSSEPDEIINLLHDTNAEQIILAVLWKNGRLGAAVYSTESSEVRLLNDIVDIRPDFQVCRHLMREINPTAVIVCNTTSPLFLNFIKMFIRDSDRENDSTQRVTEISLYLISGKYFKYEKCKNRVLSIHVHSKMADLLPENRSAFLRSWIDFNCHIMISSFGALLYFLDTHISKLMLQMPSQHILSLKILNLKNLLWIDEESYNALEIFSSASHPSVFKWTNAGMREGFSIYGLFNRCDSRVASRYMRVFLSHPIKDEAELESRHEIINFLIKSENEIVVKNLKGCLKHISNIANVIIRIIGTQATPTQWETFYKTVHNAVIITEICRAHCQQVVFFKELSDSVDDSLYIITRVIESVMDVEKSRELGRFTVKRGAVVELDEIKQRYEDLPQIMEQVAEQELSRLPDEIESCSLIYFPEIGYLLAVPAWKENLAENDLMLPNTNFKFMLNNVAHYKTAFCEEMDEILGDSHLIVLKHETEIMYQIADYIRKNVSPITNILEKIKFLDCLIALSSVTKEFDLVKPNLVSDRIIYIQKGRHILQQLCVNTYVANDYVSSTQDSLVKIFTGPNSSGKSVYLKQVALIVYLAHIGSFVPAEKATIGILDYLHTRIHANESISSDLSSFMLDLRQMYSCLYNSTPNTLIVLDEFGKGTADTDGIALLSACLNDLLGRNSNCPHILISTHFHFLLKLLPASPLIKLQTLEFVTHDGEVSYLYKVQDGSVSSSMAHNVAMNIGFPKRVMDRSNEILSAIQSEKIIVAPHYNFRIILQKRRKDCLRQILRRQLVTEGDFVEVIHLLNNVRF